MQSPERHPHIEPNFPAVYLTAYISKSEKNHSVKSDTVLYDNPSKVPDNILEPGFPTLTVFPKTKAHRNSLLLVLY